MTTTTATPAAIAPPAQTPPGLPVVVVEPSADDYARLGRYTAALLGSHSEWDSEMLEHLAEAAQRFHVGTIGGQSEADYRLWRGVADDLGIVHDGEDEDEGETCACGADLGTLGEACEACDGLKECTRCDDDLPAGRWDGLCASCEAETAAARA